MAEDKNLFVPGYSQASIWGVKQPDESTWGRLPNGLAGPSATSLHEASRGSPGTPGTGAGAAGSSMFPMVSPLGSVGGSVAPPGLPGAALNGSMATSVPVSHLREPNLPSYAVQPPLSGSTPVSRTSSGASAMASGHAFSSKSHTPSDDELIPTAIVVKNIPFAIKKEQLIDVMTQLGLPLPYAFNYHFDNGVFRGLAFANFTSPEETAVVISHLNGREVGGRKLRVEYKKMLPLQERERIEREKRERRGQLEEQHVGSTLGGASGSGGVSPPGHHHSLSSGTASPPASRASVSPSAQSSTASSPVAWHQPSVREADRAAVGADMNDPETLGIYTSLVMIRNDDKVGKVALSPGLSPRSVQLIETFCAELGLSFSICDGVSVVARNGFSGPQFPSDIFRGATVLPLDTELAFSPQPFTWVAPQPLTRTEQIHDL